MNAFKLERRVSCEAFADDGNRSITVFACYRNFQTWYDVEIDRWVDGKIVTTKIDMLDIDQAFDYFDNYIQKYNLTVKEK